MVNYPKYAETFKYIKKLDGHPGKNESGPYTVPKVVLQGSYSRKNFRILSGFNICCISMGCSVSESDV